MREIKLRVWDFSRKRMIYFHNLKPCDGTPDGFDNVWIDSESNAEIIQYDADYSNWMEFTGLKANGKEIYEGDIIGTMPTYEDEEVHKYLIKFGKGTFDSGHYTFQGFYFINLETKEQAESEMMPYNNYYDFEIIGNKFENPELLNDKKSD